MFWLCMGSLRRYQNAEERDIEMSESKKNTKKQRKEEKKAERIESAKLKDKELAEEQARIRSVKNKKRAEAVKLMSPEQLTKCNVAIHIAAGVCGLVGAVPIPLADALPISGAQILMTIRLGKVFDQELTKAAAKGLINSVLASWVGRNLVKLIPVAGWIVSAGVAVLTTEALGWSIAVDVAKSARKQWESEHGYAIDKDADTSALDEESIRQNELIQCLVDRAQEFLQGEKNPEDNKDELRSLKGEIENILDEVAPEHPLRDIYDDLCQL